MDFNFEAFKQTLYKESKLVFPEIIKQLKSEGIYSIALYRCGDDWRSISPSVLTDKELNAVAAKYKRDQQYMDQFLSEIITNIKWSVEDSSRHQDLLAILAGSNAFCSEITELMEEYTDTNQDSEAKELDELLSEACLEVLSRLDKEGAFDAIERSSFVLNLLSDKQTKALRFQRAKQLNPTKVIKAFQADFR